LGVYIIMAQISLIDGRLSRNLTDLDVWKFWNDMLNTLQELLPMKLTNINRVRFALIKDLITEEEASGLSNFCMWVERYSMKKVRDYIQLVFECGHSRFTYTCYDREKELAHPSWWIGIEMICAECKTHKVVKSIN
jgi:hypothetical protein